MNPETDTLRPYPVDLEQENVVRRIIRLKKRGPVSRIQSLFANTSRRITLSFYEYIKRTSRPKEMERKDANEIIPPRVHTSTNTMDSKFYYAICDGRIWFKPMAAHIDSPWKLFDKNGYADKRKTPLISISADGDNLIVIDQNQRIHYAKTNRIICQVSFIRPQWTIIQSSVQWKVKWFSMTGVCLIVNLFKNPILRPIPNARSIAMSHKGPDTMYYTDMNGKRHPDPYIGVTTIYVLSEDGTRIFFADPWLHNKFGNEITTPEDGRFKAESMAASGSTLMLLQRARDEHGEEINKIYTRFADFDSIGSNPALRGTYNRKNRIPLIRFLPAEDWVRQPNINLSGQARLTKNIAVLQIGWGQNNRQLRVQGQDEHGRYGYYFKNIYDLEWNFEIIQNIMIDESDFLSRSVPHTGFEQGPVITETYTDGLLNSTETTNLSEVILENFSRRGLNERCLHTKLILSPTNDMKLSLPLCARRGWMSLLGISNKNIWKLIIPDEYYSDDNREMHELLHQLFRNKRKLSVNVDERISQVRITNAFHSRARFEFIFHKETLL